MNKRDVNEIDKERGVWKKKRCEKVLTVSASLLARSEHGTES